MPTSERADTDVAVHDTILVGRRRGGEDRYSRK